MSRDSARMSSKPRTTPTKNEARPAWVPKLRFPEFRNKREWQVKKLNELLFEVKARNRTLELGAADVLSVSGEYGCVNQIEFMGRSYAGVSVRDYHVVEHGDLVYTKSPLKKNPFGIIKENKGKRGIVSTLYAVYRPLSDCSATYLDHFFSRDYNLNAYLQPIVKKGAKNDMKVNNADVLKGKISVPELPEQQRIAECLSSVDEVIAAQARTVEALKTHKKGLMERLFPREGETQPRLRFADFRDAGGWSEGRIADIAIVLQGYGFPERHQGQTSGDYPFYKVSDISRSLSAGRVFIGESANYINESLLKELRAKPIPEGTTIFAKIGEAIRSNRRAITTVPCLIDNNAAGVKRIKGKATDFFIYLLMEQVSLIDHGGGVVPAVNKSAIEEVVVKFPELGEQERIASCLSSLDALITAETQKHEALKTHKKGLMQKLFPSPEEVEA
jgi:type I restriction enzyme S subunit